MKKVCHITSVHDSHDGRIFEKECCSLARSGEFDVTLVAPGESREDSGVHVVGVGPVPSGRVRRAMSFTKTVFKKAVEIDADIYHFHDPELLSTGRKLKRLGKKVIFDSHENTTDQILIKPYLPGPAKKIVSGRYHSLETSVAGEIDAVIVPCKFEGKNIFEGRARRTVYINNYPSLSSFPDVPEGEKDYEYDICVVGSLTEERGVTNLLKAVQISGASLLLGGDFSSEEYHRMLDSEGLLKNVTYMGRIARDVMMGYLAKSRIGVFAPLPVAQYIKMDNMATKSFEYMAMRMPVVAMDSRYNREVMEKYRFGLLVDSTSPVAIAEAITRLLGDEELCRSLGAEGRRAVEEVFNWEAEEKKLLELYRDLSK